MIRDVESLISNAESVGSVVSTFAVIVVAGLVAIAIINLSAFAVVLVIALVMTVVMMMSGIVNRGITRLAAAGISAA